MLVLQLIFMYITSLLLLKSSKKQHPWTLLQSLPAVLPHRLTFGARSFFFHVFLPACILAKQLQTRKICNKYYILKNTHFVFFIFVYGRLAET